MQTSFVHKLIFFINNQQAVFFKPTTVFQACLKKAIFLPRFCYHAYLSIAGNCRMCLVEEKSVLKPVPSCAVPVKEGDNIYTDTELVRRAREGVLEYLLINHPLDCPICDQGGECDLQDQTMVFGADRGRFYERKRTVLDKNFGFLVKTVLTRCIHCSRCTRFMTELAGLPVIQLLGRGNIVEVGTYTRTPLISEVAGNVTDLCPVGALTSKPAAYKSRAWELVRVFTNDIMDGLGASIQIEYRGLEILRILPRSNSYLNDDWISDCTRFFFDAIYHQRLLYPLIVVGGKWKNVGWLPIFNTFKNFLNNSFKFNEPEFTILTPGLVAPNFEYGNFQDLETMLLSNLISFKLFGTIPSTGMALKRTLDSRVHYGLNNILFKLGQLSSDWTNTEFVFLNSNIRYESPILNLKLRFVLVENLSTSVCVFGFISNFNYFIQHFGTRFTYSVINKLNSHFNNKVFFSNNLSPIDYFSAKRSKTISNHLTNAGSSELGFCFNTRKHGTVVEFWFGSPEYPISLTRHFLKLLVSLMSHEEMFTMKGLVNHCILLPVKFYLEKISTFVGNSFNFFSTYTHFATTSSKHVREEWRILLVLYEFVGISKIHQPSLNSHPFNFLARHLPINKIRVQKQLSLYYFFTDSSTRFFCINPSKSFIDNFFSSNFIARNSKNLSLCAKKVILETYKNLVNNNLHYACSF